MVNRGTYKRGKLRKSGAKQVVIDATFLKISPNYNTTFKITRVALYFPKPVGGRATIDNCKKEGWTVGIKLLVDINDLKLKKEAAKLGMTIEKMMIILKDQLENCSATICIESDIDKNTAIKEITNKMKFIMGGSVVSHSLHQNTKPVIASHANYGRGKIEGKYDDYTTAFHPGTVGVACSMLIIAKSRTKDDRSRRTRSHHTHRRTRTKESRDEAAHRTTIHCATC